jgi:sugar phosphate isomerase/epimerase
MRTWRLSQTMDKYEEIRKKYNDTGVTIDIVKFGLGASMTDEEIDYCFRVAKTLGCRAITCEPPVSETRRLGKFAEKHEIRLGFHNHSNAEGVESFCRPGSWEQAFFYSDWNYANVDIGHFCAGNSISPDQFIRLYHDRITNLHLKDRKFNQGPNMPWGQGDTPIKEILQLMKREQYDFMATIELEYPTPEGSDVMTELQKCVEYCKDALA